MVQLSRVKGFLHEPAITAQPQRQAAVRSGANVCRQMGIHQYHRIKAAGLRCPVGQINQQGGQRHTPLGGQGQRLLQTNG
jgi:hypothetical protein